MRLNGSISKTSIVLLLLGCVSLALYRAGVSAKEVSDIRFFIKVALIQSVIYLPAVWIVMRARSSRAILLLAIVFAILFRLSILFSTPYLSDDIYRYIWDGRVQAAGINPFRYVPAAPELAHLRDDAIYPEINRRDYAHTIYPPLAQIVFFLTTRVSESVVWMKITMLLFEAIAIWAIARLLALLGQPKQRLLIFAWHPLVVWEFAGSGHIDAMAIAFIALAFLASQRSSNIRAGLALAGATLVKLFPLVLLPAMFKPPRWKIALAFVAAIIVAYLPYLSVGPTAVFGSLPGYAHEQGLVSGAQFYGLSLAQKLFGSGVPSISYVIATILVMGAIGCWALARTMRDEDSLKSAMVLATATTVLFAPHYSWYFCWLVFFLCFTRSLTVFYLTIANFVLYATWLGDSPEQMFVINSVIYLPALFIFVVELLWRRLGFQPISLRQMDRVVTER